MTGNISPVTQQMLQRFVEGSCDPDEFESWLVAASEDDAALDGERTALPRLRLIMIECGEGLRSLDELRFEAVALLAESGRRGVVTWTTTAGSSQGSTFKIEPAAQITQIGSPA